MKIYKLIEVFAIIILLYNILPNLYFRHCSSSIKRRVSNSNNIYLTFDDGPNPKYTMEILDILKEYNAKATFFVIATRAEEYKYIINRIVEEGHTLGLHSYNHKSALLSTPRQTKKDFEKSMAIFKELNFNVEYSRPPWGHFNLLSYYYGSKEKLKFVFWTRITKDWDINTIVDEIVNESVDNIAGGDIIVLHDSSHKSLDKEDVPKNTIEALKIILSTLTEEGFEFQAIGKDIKENEKVGINI